VSSAGDYTINFKLQFEKREGDLITKQIYSIDDAISCHLYRNSVLIPIAASLMKNFVKEMVRLRP
jgi:hypothetical protein